MAKIPRRVKCSVCKKGWAKLGMSFNLDAYVRGRAISDKTKRDFRYVFRRDQVKRLETTRDIDACFSDFHRRYPHLPPPGPIRRDPHPEIRLKDKPGNNPERLTGV